MMCIKNSKVATSFIIRGWNTDISTFIGYCVGLLFLNFYGHCIISNVLDWVSAPTFICRGLSMRFILTSFLNMRSLNLGTTLIHQGKAMSNNSVMEILC